MRVSPGLFGVGGLAAANVVAARNGEQTFRNTLQADAAGNLSPVPIDLGSGDQQTYLILYGTGIRNHSGPVTAMLGNTAVTAAFAGPQGTFAGEDQINLELPELLRGAGLVDVTLMVDGQTTNAVKIRIQ